MELRFTPLPRTTLQWRVQRVTNPCTHASGMVFSRLVTALAPPTLQICATSTSTSPVTPQIQTLAVRMSIPIRRSTWTSSTLIAQATQWQSFVVKLAEYLSRMSLAPTQATRVLQATQRAVAQLPPATRSVILLIRLPITAPSQTSNSLMKPLQPLKKLTATQMYNGTRLLGYLGQRQAAIIYL